ncbi:malate:quinone oxidoreductase [Flavobacterium sp. HNIBRBA15423]|uniref:malate:quinone oxidoreductase n=1 Tax=Flavobacterium sp. HNIBRBA15423 TaxID=3458683 RepID=UPI004045097A
MENPDVVLIGAGIMSATLGILLKELNPDCKIEIFERLSEAASESSDAWNNAGTGHAAFCELNYTPEKEDGSIDISKALKISEAYEVSRQFWSYLVQKEIIKNPEDFIHSIPHVSFVWGDDNVKFLKKRHEALIQKSLFKRMLFSTNKEVLNNWIPLVVKNRDENVPAAATYMPIGTDVNFGSLTRLLFEYLKNQDGITLYFQTEVEKLKKQEEGDWKIKVRDLDTKKSRKIKTPFVFIGAGGGSLRLLEKANIEEGDGYGGFPISGQWLRCMNPEIIKQHKAKVYGKASVGSPPMSVPHIDTRIIDGKQELLFGPYAGFTTKFLKNGSYLDLLKSIQTDNIRPMLSAGINNIPLTKYLIEQVMQSQDDRMKALRNYFPDAKAEDWVLETAGKRVQVIKKDKSGKGVLEFGTEVVNDDDGSLAVLLGASPGASTSVSIMIEVISRCFADKYNSEEWQNKLKEMIPAFGEKLNDNDELCTQIRQMTSKTLKLAN